MCQKLVSGKFEIVAINDEERNKQAYKNYYVTICSQQDCTPVTDSSWRLSDRSKMFNHAGIQTGYPRSDRPLSYGVL